MTFLLTDLEGSTRLWEQNPDAMRAAMVRHDELLEKSIAAHDGYVFARMGDGMAAAFATAGDAVKAAISFQRALADETWGPASPLRARIGLHTDEGIVVNDNNYVSQPVNRAARLMAAAHGGQIVLSGATEALVREELPQGRWLTDLGEHRLRDLGRPLRVYQLSSADLSEEFPPLRSLDAFPGNLPPQVSSFVGRQAEARRVASALEASRVVTLTGVGGVGKTRMAIQVAAELLPRFREGAWLVELAPIRDPEGVIEAVAAAFRLSRRPGQSLEESLLEMLANKQLLLVLDNCEHLISPAAKFVTRIERECPGIVVLATSREGLAVDGEQLIALPPLETGMPSDDLERLMATDAVSLFVDRARHVKADFALTHDNARAVVEVCQRLDGVPLAIELAAARVIALGPAELARRLDRRFQVLAGGRRGAVERHATLRAAIDWSYELLTPAEQWLLIRMAVFSGGCTLEAIEEVCSGDSVDREVILDLVTGLVTRSLVVAEDSAAGTRFRLLETIRQYGEEKLAKSGEIGALLIAHAGFYADLSARASQYYYGPDQLAWATRINFERDNTRAALATAVDTANAAMAVRMLANHPHHHGYGGTGEVFEIPAWGTVIDMPGARDEPGYPHVLMAAAWQAYLRGDYDQADGLRRQAVEIDTPHTNITGRPRVEVDGHNLTAMASLAAGDYAAAVVAYQRGAELAAADGFPGLAAINIAIGVNTALLGGGDVENSAEAAEKAVKLARGSGMHAAIVISLNTLAMALVDDDPRRSRALLNESNDRSTTPAESSPTGVLTACLAAARLADWDLTLALAARSMQLERWVMAPLQVAPCLALCARALAERRPEAAGVLQGAAYSAFRRAAADAGSRQREAAAPVGPNANFVLSALHDVGDIVATSLGAERARELRGTGNTMSMDEAITFALNHIDPRSRNEM
ncbi:adenylate/guanylate cyclase domain-containing protein [Mycobacterium sp. NPDC051804]|uniref:adenylate/guanylate cyclase domain-containing protein n=1 Tax=Mycobacterium sp. NPDC051804 TaxID=3364295 RepID=UPI00378D66EE